MKVIKAPTRWFPNEHPRTVFLAGSIDQGKAPDWQTELVSQLAILPITILNPRRDDWDASWVQSAQNQQFREQVEWELQAMKEASFVVMYFAPETQSPITLLELGLLAGNPKLIVCCPEGFWRKGNVDLVCDKYRIPTVAKVGDFAAHIAKRFMVEVKR